MVIIYKFDKSDGSESRGEVSDERDERVVMTRKFCQTLVNLEVTPDVFSGSELQSIKCVYHCSAPFVSC